MTSRRVLLVGVLCWVIAGAAYGALRLTFGPRPVYVSVTWAPTVDDTVRQWLERKYRLTQRELRQGQSYQYALLDASDANVKALVTDASVADTQDIDRNAFHVYPTATLAPYDTSYPWVPVRLRGVTILGAVLGLFALALGFVEIVAPGTAGRWCAPRPRGDVVLLLILTAALLLRLQFATTAEYIHDEDNGAILRSQAISFDPGNLKLPLRGQNHPLLTAYFVKVSGIVFGTTRLGYRLVNLLAGLGIIVMVYALARRWFGPVAARWSAALLAFNEYFLGVSSRATAHVPYLVCTGAAIYGFGRFVQTERPGYLYATGAALGVSFYAKEHSALLLPIFLLVLLQARYRRWFRGPHLYLAPMLFLLVIAPDLLWNLAAREVGTSQATYADHLQRIGGIGFSPYPLMFYGRDATQWLFTLITERRLFDPTSEYLSVNLVTGLLLLGTVLVTTFRGARPEHRFLLCVFWGVFGFFTAIRPGGSPKDLDPASWIWVDVTLFPAVMLAGAWLAGATGRWRASTWALTCAALVYAGAVVVG